MQINITEFLKEAVQRGVDNIYVIPGMPLTISIRGKASRVGQRMIPDDTLAFVQELYRMARKLDVEESLAAGDDNFSFTVPGVARFRVSMLRQRNSFGCMIRLIRFDLPDPASINIPPVVMNLANLENGLVLVTGASGSGKTTTMACVIDAINRTRDSGLIITLENPLEYVHSHKMSIVTQREIYTDTADYETALRSSMYQRPSVLMLSDIPTVEVAQSVLHTAQSGCLLLTSLFASGAADAIRNLVDMFDPVRQDTVRAALAEVLQAVVFQRMIPDVDGNIMPVFETVYVGNAMRELIREGNIAQISEMITGSKMPSVVSLDRSLLELYRKHQITRDTVMKFAVDKDRVRRQLFT